MGEGWFARVLRDNRDQERFTQATPLGPRLPFIAPLENPVRQIQLRSDGVINSANTKSYRLLMKDDGHTWCGYADSTEFEADVKKRNPTESARVTFSSDKLIEVTHQLSAESGDWVVLDEYTPSNDRLFLRRTNLLVQPPGFQIIEETSIHGGRVEAFHVVSTTTPDGKTVDASNADIPAVSVVTNLSEALM